MTAVCQAAEIFGRMNTSQRTFLVRLYESKGPCWYVGAEEVLAPCGLSELGLTASFLVKRLIDDRELPFMRLSELGYRVLGYALRWRDAERYVRPGWADFGNAEGGQS